MSKKKFTAAAELLWGAIPKWAQERICQSVFCTKCRTSVEIIDYAASVKNGDLVLQGQCVVCSHQVVRLVETSEAKPPNN